MGIVTKTRVLVAVVGLGVAGSAGAANWTGIVASARATDWSQAGIPGGVPHRTTICASLNPGATAAQINSAIAACPGGQVVELGAGTFNLSGAINIRRSDVTLRGQGMSTVLNFSSSSGYNFYWGSALIAVQHSGFSGAGDNVAPSYSGVPASTVRNWVGTNGQAGVYTQGATVLNLDAAPTGLTVGGTLTLWQSDAPDNSVPNNGYFVSDKAGVDGNNISWVGSGQANNSGQQQRVKVIAINGSSVTIWPGLYRPTGTWATARSPKIGWQSGVISGVGLEDFRVTRSVKTVMMIGFNVAAESWVSGVGLVGGVSGGDYGIQFLDSRHLTVRNSWWDPFRGGGVYTTTSYGISLVQGSGFLVENNIFNGVESPIMLNAGTTGSVIAYNYEKRTTGEGGLQTHEPGPAMNLLEGNSVSKFWADMFHGNTALTTLFRNHFTEQGVDLMAYHRWYNVVGNVINADVYKSVYSDPTKYNRWSSVAFRLGYSSQNPTAGSEPGYNVYPDPVVATSSMLWGNFVTDGGGTRWLANEVPSNDAVFPNPVPATENLPASFYRSSRPEWWPAGKAWPLIGPDVTGGTIAGYSGHAYKLPSEDCFAAAGGSLANFNVGACYADGEGSFPPSNFRLVP